MERFGETKKRGLQDESDTENKNSRSWSNKIANLDQTCKKKTMKGKLGKDA